MDFRVVQGQPWMLPRGPQGSGNGNGSGRKFSDQCFHCGHPGHISRDNQHYTGNRPQLNQGKSAFMGGQGQYGHSYEYVIVLPPLPPAGQPPATANENLPKNR